MATKTIISATDKPEAAEIFSFVQSWDDEKQKAFSMFVDGAKFMQSLMIAAQPPDARPSA